LQFIGAARSSIPFRCGERLRQKGACAASKFVFGFLQQIDKNRVSLRLIQPNKRLHVPVRLIIPPWPLADLIGPGMLVISLSAYRPNMREMDRVLEARGAGHRGFPPPAKLSPKRHSRIVCRILQVATGVTEL
jgi:hypothetical protein